MPVTLMIREAPVVCCIAWDRVLSPGNRASIDDQRSTSGVLYCLGQSYHLAIEHAEGGGPVLVRGGVHWSAGACQKVCLTRLLRDLIGSKPGVPVLEVDNKSAIDFSKNPVHYGRSKHIDTKFHYIRECVDGGKIVLEQISTKDQLADILTKSLGRVLFQELHDRVGVVNLKSLHQD